jgi:hypothetical protein
MDRREPETFTEMRRKAIEWHNTMECLPTFEELREVEYIRQRGEHNMFIDNITRIAYDWGLYDAVCWLHRCKEARISWMKVAALAEPELVAEHGPRESWITPEIKRELDDRVLDAEEQRLERELHALKAKRRAERKNGR